MEVQKCTIFTTLFLAVLKGGLGRDYSHLCPTVTLKINNIGPYGYLSLLFLFMFLPPPPTPGPDSALDTTTAFSSCFAMILALVLSAIFRDFIASSAADRATPMLPSKQMPHPRSCTKVLVFTRSCPKRELDGNRSGSI